MSIIGNLTTGRWYRCCRPVGFLFISVLMASANIAFYSANAQGNLLITPRRIVFEGNKRSFDLNLANTGNDTATYAISLIQIRMTDDGGTVQITEPDSGQRFADKHLRFFPRQVTLGPNESQLVKVQLLRSNDLTNGEYRSHFYFRSVPKPVPLGEESKMQRDTNSISVRLTPIFGITIPVIIRIGEPVMKVTLSNAVLNIPEGADPVITFMFSRSGNISVYGDIAIDHISPQGKVTRVGIANGVAVYTPNTRRKFSMNLNRLEGVDYRSGRIRITYSAPSDLKPAKYAETEIVLGN